MLKYRHSLVVVLSHLTSAKGQGGREGGMESMHNTQTTYTHCVYTCTMYVHAYKLKYHIRNKGEESGSKVVGSLSWQLSW